MASSLLLPPLVGAPGNMPESYVPQLVCEVEREQRARGTEEREYHSALSCVAGCAGPPPVCHRSAPETAWAKAAKRRLEIVCPARVPSAQGNREDTSWSKLHRRRWNGYEWA